MVVTLRVGRQQLGLPVNDVRDVLPQQKVAPIPLAPPEVLGSLTLRGRIVTVVDLRRRLKLPAPESPVTKGRLVIVDIQGELYGLQVDAAGEVLTLPSSEIDPPPANLGGGWEGIATGVYKLEDGLLVLVDARALLGLN